MMFDLNAFVDEMRPHGVKLGSITVDPAASPMWTMVLYTDDDAHEQRGDSPDECADAFRAEVGE